jgi:hypothetical protein
MSFVLRNAALGLLIFAALYVIAAVPDYWRALLRHIRYRGSANWPIRQGTITAQQIVTLRGRRFQAVLMYSYNVDGRMYSGVYRSQRFAAVADAERLAAKYPVGAAAMVRIGLRRAGDSLLVLPE